MTNIKKPHVHAEIIKAWADGETIQFRNGRGDWYDLKQEDTPGFHVCYEYRIKPEPKPDITYFGCAKELCNDHHLAFSKFTTNTFPSYDNLKLTFDGETGKLKSAEVIGN